MLGRDDDCPVGFTCQSLQCQIAPGERRLNVEHRQEFDDDDGRNLADAGRNLDDDGRNLDDAGRNLDDDGRNLDDDGRNLDDDGRNLDDDGRNLDDDGRNLDDDGRNLDDDGRATSTTTTGGTSTTTGGTSTTTRGNVDDDRGNVDDDRGNVDDDRGNVDDDGRNVDDDDRRDLDDDGRGRRVAASTVAGLDDDDRRDVSTSDGTSSTSGGTRLPRVVGRLLQWRNVDDDDGRKVFHDARREVSNERWDLVDHGRFRILDRRLQHDDHRHRRQHVDDYERREAPPRHHLRRHDRIRYGRQWDRRKRRCAGANAAARFQVSILCRRSGCSMGVGAGRRHARVVRPLRTPARARRSSSPAPRSRRVTKSLEPRMRRAIARRHGARRSRTRSRSTIRPHDGHAHTHERWAGPGLFRDREPLRPRDFRARAAFTVGIGGPVGSGKTKR